VIVLLASALASPVPPPVAPVPPPVASVEAEVPYLLVMDVVTRAKIPFAGERDVITRSVAAVRFEHTPTGWVQHQRPCSVEVIGGNVRFPDGFVASMPSRADPIAFEGGAYRFDPGPTWVGQLAGTPLVEEMDHPDARDHEGDGHPGATVLLELPVFGTVRLYITQISHSVLVGRLADGEIAGRVEVVRLEQHTLGASAGVFAVSPRVTLVPDQSRFTLTRDRAGRCAAP